MPYIYEKVDALEGQALAGPPYGCAVLVQWYAKAPAPAQKRWKAGIVVKGNGASIKKGTAIATFVKGRYPNTLHGKHAALYVEQDASGIWVIEQWETLDKIQKRKLTFRGTSKDGTYIDSSNNADAFSVIEPL